MLNTEACKQYLNYRLDVLESEIEITTDTLERAKIHIPNSVCDYENKIDRALSEIKRLTEILGEQS